MRNRFAPPPARRPSALLRRGWLAGFSLLTLAVSGCAGGGLFSTAKGPSREEELVKTLNEERKRAQYYQSQYEQALARLDGDAPPAARRASSAFSSREINDRFVSAEPAARPASKGSASSSTSKAIARLASTLPGLRVGPDQTWAKLDADLLFGGGSEELSPGADALLTDLAKTLSQESARDLRVLVVGYSDTQRGDETEPAAGGEDVTWRIAAERAVGVVRKLTQSGVAPDRLSAMSRGAQDPIAGNDTPAARAQNRRVEIYLLEPTSTWAPDWTAALR